MPSKASKKLLYIEWFTTLELELNQHYTTFLKNILVLKIDTLNELSHSIHVLFNSAWNSIILLSIFVLFKLAIGTKDCNFPCSFLKTALFLRRHPPAVKTSSTCSLWSRPRGCWCPTTAPPRSRSSSSLGGRSPSRTNPSSNARYVSLKGASSLLQTYILKLVECYHFKENDY